MADSEELDIVLSEWMTRLPESLRNIPLNQLAIPGSHNSFSANLDRTSGIGTDVPAAVRTFGVVFKDVIHRYSVTQKYSLTNQLNHGIRYFDFRVSTKPGTDSLHFLHALFGATVESGLREINEFLIEHPREIILMDFNHFYDMNEESHKRLLHLIEKLFKRKLCMFVGVENATLNMLWENNLQVIVFYQDKIVQENSQFWPSWSVQSPWAKTIETPRLIHYLEMKYKEERAGDSFISWQGVLTPDPVSILQNVTGSVSDLAAGAMPAFLEWLESKRIGEGGINICIADFIDLCDFPMKVIRLNYKLDPR